ncbi:hypothetical protein ACWN8M_06075 [Pseudolactococcus reticulitermitis]|uniref:S1 motif domain-containing protein n=1 Tax=Pseudolactococcus reticulitermitis TaxID=2025039 RepID=A0A224X153_9LACT|nr:hypothetical protein RsY01_1540 [Lactococcus reticulitermitis]
MMGRVKSISRFGLFVTFLASDLSQENQARFDNISDDFLLTGLLRWSDVPRGEKFQRNDALTVTVKEIHDDGKIDLRVTPENFREKYDNILARTGKILQGLRDQNRKGSKS